MNQLNSTSVIPVRQEDIQLVFDWTKNWLGGAHPLAYSLTVFSSPGYTNFLKYQQSIPWPYNPTRLMGIYEGNDLLAFIEVRILPDCLFINNLCVNPEKRGRKTGERLLQEVILLAKSLQLPAVKLDCFVWNARVLEMYKEMGFQIKETMYWLTGDHFFQEEKKSLSFLVDGYPSAEINQKEFGFSQFQVKTSERAFSVNRLKNEYFRVAGSPASTSSEYLAILAHLDQTRQLFFISQEEETAGQYEKVSSSVRMEKRI